MEEKVSRENVQRLAGVLEKELEAQNKRRKFLLEALVKMSKRLTISPIKTWNTYREYAEVYMEVQMLQGTLKTLRRTLK